MFGLGCVCSDCIHGLEQQLEASRNQSTELSARIAELTKSAGEKTSQIDSLQSKNRTLQTIEKDLRYQLDLASKEHASCAQSHATITANVHEQEEKLQQAKSELLETQRAKALVEARLATVSKQLNDLHHASASVTKLQTELGDRTAEANELETALNQIEQQLKETTQKLTGQCSASYLSSFVSFCYCDIPP